MDDAIKDLLLNVLFVLLPLFYYHLLWFDKLAHSRAASLISGLVGSLSIVLCMAFPIEAGPGLIVDLRQIPLIVVTLYGGTWAGMISFSMLLLYRFYLGGSGFFMTLSVSSILMALLLLSAPFLRKQSTQKKIAATVAFALLGWGMVYLFYIFLYKSPDDSQTVHLFWLELLAAKGITMGFLTSSIEFAHKNNQIRDELERTKKLELVSELAASVSHEVRNPLTAARGFIQLMKQNNLPPEKHARFLDIALQELDHAEAIIGEFLNFANPKPEMAETLSVAQEVKYAAEAVSHSAQLHKVAISIHAANECLIHGERDKFRQCIINLARNAVEAMPNGGTLSISIFTKGRKVMVRLQDEGVGMTREQINRLGTPYYSIKDKGTGLGTMVAFSNIQAMGGKIDVESKLGRGTSFTLTLPCAASYCQ